MLGVKLKGALKLHYGLRLSSASDKCIAEIEARRCREAVILDIGGQYHGCPEHGDGIVNTALCLERIAQQQQNGSMQCRFSKINEAARQVLPLQKFVCCKFVVTSYNNDLPR